jgi:Lon protease-like protein
MPLHIFEPRYRRLVTDLQQLAPEEQAFGVVAIRRGREVGSGSATALYDIGCMAALRDVQPYPDGRFDIATVGTRRFTVKRLHDSRAPYLQADIEFLDDDEGDVDSAVLSSVSRRFARYRQVVRTDENDAPIPGDPTALSWAVASGMVLDLDEKQQLLACATAADRLTYERVLLGRETALLEELPSLPVFDARQFTISRN